MARIRKIMSTNVLILKKEARIEEAAKLLSKESNSCVVIVENNRPIGIVTEHDFLRGLVSKDKRAKNLSEIMVYPVTFMTPNMKLEEALKIVDTKRYRSYPVVENEELIGLVTKNDIVNAMSDNVRFHRNIQNIVLILFVLFEFFVFVLY